MILIGDYDSPTGTDWKVTVPSGRATTVFKVTTAYVDEKTGTLHFQNAQRETIQAFARGFWVHVEPVK